MVFVCLLQNSKKHLKLENNLIFDYFDYYMEVICMKFVSIVSIILLSVAGISDLSAMHKPMHMTERKTPAKNKSGKHQRLNFGLEKFNFAKSLTGNFGVKPQRHKREFRPPTPPRKRPDKRKHEPDHEEQVNNNAANKRSKVETKQVVKKVHAAMQTESDAKQERKQVNAAVQTDATPGVSVGMDNQQSFANLCAPSEQQIKSLLIVDKRAGIAPIHYLAIKNNEDVLAVLGTVFQQSLYSITSAEFFNAQDACKRTPLHHAVQHKHYTLVEWLLIHDADINAQDSNGFTPLHIAAQDRNEKMIRILVDAGA